MLWGRGGENAAEEAPLRRDVNLWITFLPSLPTHRTTPVCLRIISHTVSNRVEFRLPIIVLSVYEYILSFDPFSSLNVLFNISLYPNS